MVTSDQAVGPCRQTLRGLARAPYRCGQIRQVVPLTRFVVLRHEFSSDHRRQVAGRRAELPHTHPVAHIRTGVKGIQQIHRVGPPAWKTTGISRPIAADHTINISPPSALAVAAFHRHRTNTAASAARRAAMSNLSRSNLLAL